MLAQALDIYLSFLPPTGRPTEKLPLTRIYDTACTALFVLKMMPSIVLTVSYQPKLQQQQFLKVCDTT